MTRINYPTLPIRRKYLPDADLKLLGQYGRYLEVPSDVIPTIGGIILMDKDDSKSWTGQDDGSGNVFITGIKAGVSLGGGATGPVTVRSYNLSQTALDGQSLGPIGPPTKPIHGVIFSVCYDMGGTLQTNLNGYASIRVESANAGLTDQYYLATVGLSSPASGTTLKLAGEANWWSDKGIILNDPLLDGFGNIGVVFSSPNFPSGCNVNCCILQEV